MTTVWGTIHRTRVIVSVKWLGQRGMSCVHQIATRQNRDVYAMAYWPWHTHHDGAAARSCLRRSYALAQCAPPCPLAALGTLRRSTIKAVTLPSASRTISSTNPVAMRARKSD